MAPVAIATKKTDSGRRRAEEGHLQPKGEERTSLTALEKEVLAEEVRVWVGLCRGGGGACVFVLGAGRVARKPGTPGEETDSAAGEMLPKAQWGPEEGLQDWALVPTRSWKGPPEWGVLGRSGPGGHGGGAFQPRKGRW